MENEDEIEPEIDPDRLAKKLGVPMPGPVDPLTYNTNLIGMYREATKPDKDRPLWVRILAVIIGTGFLVPFIVYAIMIISFIKDYGIQQAVNSMTILIVPIIFLAIGIKIIYENIKSINKNKNINK